MPFTGDFRELKDTISSALVETTRAAGQISNEDLAFQRSSNPSVATLLDRQNARLLNLTNRLTKAATLDAGISPPHLADADSVDENWKSIVDVFDNLLEKADACLDEFTGSIKRVSPGLEEQIKKAGPAQAKNKNVKTRHRSDIVKPQLLFKDKPNNNERTPFRPLLQEKPHALVPLEESLGFVDPSDDVTEHKHPYDLEITAARYPPSTFLKTDSIPYLPFDETKATFVDTPEAVATMLGDLQQAKEIAIDLEHHDEHSYTGLVSLMQISTREKDWVVDTLRPWRRDLQILNEVFADPNILKVLHGAFMDIIWLQRDLGLYVVNLFDTFHASRALGYPQKSLAYLLKTFANFDAAKQYQMADWRIRPLPEEMFNYARSDTHYLLYIFDNMRNALIDKAVSTESGETPIETVMRKSKEVALQKYERHSYDFHRGSGPTGWYNMLCRSPALFNREQFAVFRAVHQWRDEVARQEDESLHVVMPKHVLYNLAREIPLDISSLLGCSHPMSKIFQVRKEELLGVIQRAKTLGANGPDMRELMQEIDTLLYQSATRPEVASAPPTDGIKMNTKVTKWAEPSESGLALRSHSSSFWGPSMSNATFSGPVIDRQYHSLALPLPQLVSEVFEENGHTSESRIEVAKASPGAMIENQNVTNDQPKESDIFILKDDSGSRKRKATTNPAASEIQDHDLELERKQTRAEQKAEKKRSKKAKIDEANQPLAHGDDAMEPFDYANAPSLLQSKQTGADRTATAQQGFNPYAKSMDAPRGVRKNQKEVAGKSHTFSS